MCCGRAKEAGDEQVLRCFLCNAGFFRGPAQDLERAFGLERVESGTTSRRVCFAGSMCARNEPERSYVRLESEREERVILETVDKFLLHRRGTDMTAARTSYVAVENGRAGVCCTISLSEACINDRSQMPSGMLQADGLGFATPKHLVCVTLLSDADAD